MPPPSVAELPDRVELVTVTVPELSMPPPAPVVFPLAIASPEILAVTRESTVNTLKSDEGPPPETVSDDAPGPVIVVWSAVLLRTKPLPSVIVCGMLKTDGSNWMRLPSVLELALAWWMQYTRSPVVPDPAPVTVIALTVKTVGDRSVRSSSRSNTSECRRRPRRSPRRTCAAGDEVRCIRARPLSLSVNIPMMHLDFEKVDLLRRDNNDVGVTSQRPCSPPRASQ